MRSMSIGLTVLLVLAVLAVHGVGPRFATAQPPDAGAAPVSGVFQGGDPIDGEAAPSPRGTTVVFTLATVTPSPSGNVDVGTRATAEPAEPTASVEPAESTTTEPAAPGAALASGGVIAYGAVVGGQWDIYAVDVDTAESARLTSGPGDEWAPAWSPDGSRLAYLSGQGGSSQVWVMNRDGGNQRQVTRWTGPGQLYYATWSPDGSQLIVTVADNAAGVARLISQPLDGGSPSDYTEPWSGVASISETGEMAYTVRSDGQTDIVLDDGATRSITTTSLNEDIPSINRDGTGIVYQVGEPGGRYLEIYDLTTDSTRQLSPIGDDSNPVWSPDGGRIAFVSEDGQQAEIYLVGADGSGGELLPTVEHETLWYLSWST